MENMLHRQSSSALRKLWSKSALALAVGFICIMIVSFHALADTKPVLSDPVITQSSGLSTPAIKTVLMIFPSQSDLPANTLAVQAVREKFDLIHDLKIELFYEYMELSRFPDITDQQKMFDLIAARYHSRPVDLVILTGEAVLNLWLEKRDEILPHTPVVFYDIDFRHLSGRPLPEDVTGTGSVPEYLPSIRWILHARPAVDEIAVVHGVGKEDREYIYSADDLKKELGGQIRITDMSDLPLVEIKRQVQVLPPSSVVLYELMFEDAAGVRHRPIDVMRELAAASAVPVISSHDHFIGTGAVGGYMYSIDRQAGQAARMGLRILRGETAGKIPVLRDQSSSFVFDHAALQRFGIPLSALPPGSIIKNRQYSVWELYRTQLITIAVIMLVLLLLVIFFGMLVKRLNSARMAMIGLNANLEKQVQERTTVLSQTNRSLEMEITERMRAEAALRESETNHRLLIENANDAIFIVDAQSRILVANQTAAKKLGYSSAELLSMTVSQIDSQEAGRRLPDRLAMLMERGHLTFESTHACRDGSVIPVEINAQQITWDGQPAVMGICRDISERKLMEDALRESEEKFRLTFSASPDSVNINRLDDGLCVDINEGFTRLTGYTREDVIGRSSLEFGIWHDPADRQKLVQGLREKGFYNNLEAQFRTKDGRLITALMSARVISLKGIPHIVSITRDITERKLMEFRLQQSQKFEAIGTLAGGIAHDFNNLLMGIQGHASLISLDLEAYHPHLEHIHAIDEYIRRATDLTKQLLGFARSGKYEVKPIDMNELVSESSSMFGRTKKEIRIHTRCQPMPLVVEADRGQIEQVFLNMYINAWQAMPPEGGDLYLETKAVVLDEACCSPHKAEPGLYASISITDTGSGMDEAIRRQVFDPFFTTREKNRGTGLGLASAYGIIRNHGGMITVNSQVGKGSTFTIYLPASDKGVHRESPPKNGLIRGSATILLVDDEEMIIEVGQAILEKLGYHVIISRGGREAVETMKTLGNEIDLVILDMIMPEMDGSMTFEHLRQIQPKMPILLSSGYAINSQANEIMRRGSCGFIQKPYNLLEISNKVNNMIIRKNGSL